MQMSKLCFRNFNGEKNGIGTVFNQELSTTLFYFNSVTSFTVSSRKKKDLCRLKRDVSLLLYIGKIAMPFPGAGSCMCFQNPGLGPVSGWVGRMYMSPYGAGPRCS